MNLVYFVVSLILKMELDKKDSKEREIYIQPADMGKFLTHNSSEWKRNKTSGDELRAACRLTGDPFPLLYILRKSIETMLEAPRHRLKLFSSFFIFIWLCSTSSPLHERYNLIFVNKMKLDYCVECE